MRELFILIWPVWVLPILLIFGVRWLGKIYIKIGVHFVNAYDSGAKEGKEKR